MVAVQASQVPPLVSLHRFSARGRRRCSCSWKPPELTSKNLAKRSTLLSAELWKKVSALDTLFKENTSATASQNVKKSKHVKKQTPNIGANGAIDRWAISNKIFIIHFLAKVLQKQRKFHNAEILCEELPKPSEPTPPCS